MVLLTLVTFLPLVGAVAVALAGKASPNIARGTALATMVLGLLLAIGLSAAVASGPVVAKVPWIPSIGVTYHLECDGLSAILVLLTAFIGIIAVLISWHEIRERVAAFHVWILTLQTGIILVFLARDLMLFYFGWELMLIPMFFIIGVWGHEDKLYSALKFFLFTFTGSVFMLMALLYVYFVYAAQNGTYTFALADLVTTRLTEVEQWWIFLGLFVGFAVKIPLFPFHTWLPDAHTQAPTAGSLILAGLLLKTGVYGLMRFAIPMAPLGNEAFANLIIAIAIFGIFYGAFAALAQRDFKRLVAYSSISHLGFVVLGIYVGNAAGYQGGVLQMVNHGLATGGLFLVAGLLQERTHTRAFEMFGGLWRQMPTLGAFLLFFAFASLGMPGTGNFIGELYVIGGTFAFKPLLGVITVFGVLAAAVYSLKVFLATMHGPESKVFKKLEDTNLRENVALGSLAVALIIIGFYPRVVTGPLYLSPDLLVPANGRIELPAAVAPASPAVNLNAAVDYKAGTAPSNIVMAE